MKRYIWSAAEGLVVWKAHQSEETKSNCVCWTLSNVRSGFRKGLLEQVLHAAGVGLGSISA
jgi:hypothetical protein